MLVNILALLIIVILTSTARQEKLLGVLVTAYYSVYILMDLSTFGFAPNWSITTYGEFTIWYLMCAAMTILVMVFALSIWITGNRVALIYAIWLFISAVFDGASSIFQSFETNSLLIVYNSLQNMNLFVDLVVVILGTDNFIHRNKRAAYIINKLGKCVVRWWRLVTIKRN